MRGKGTRSKQIGKANKYTSQAVHLNWFYYSKLSETRCSSAPKHEEQRDETNSCILQNEEIIKFGCWGRHTKSWGMTSQTASYFIQHPNTSKEHSCSEGWFPSGPLEKFSCLTAPASQHLAITTPSHTDIVCLWLVLPEWELTKILAYGTARRERKKNLKCKWHGGFNELLLFCY